MKQDNLTPFTIKNITLNKNIIIYSGGSRISLAGKTGGLLEVPPFSLFFIEKKLCFDLTVVPIEKDAAYDFYAIPEKKSGEIKRYYESFVRLTPSDFTSHRAFEERAFFIDTDEVGVKIFKQLISQEHSEEWDGCFNLLYLLSKAVKKEGLFKSFLITSVKSFSEQVRDIINGDIGKKWRINDVSDVLNMSEITVRKKLEMESTSFNNLLLDIRMEAAMQYIIYQGFHVNQVSLILGFANPSYFIKIFKNYYGITPKQLLVCYRKANLREG